MSDKYRCSTSDAYMHNSSETSVVEISCEMSDSYTTFSENLGVPVPIQTPIVARKLDFSSLDDDECIQNSVKASAPLSPPYKRVRALRLFDSPHTPKTLLEKCSTPSARSPGYARRCRLFPPKLGAPIGMPSGSSHHLHPPSDAHHLHPPSDAHQLQVPSCDEDSALDSALGSLPPDEPLDDSTRMPRPRANINPFTPDGQALNKKKRALSKTPTSWRDATPEQPAKRLRESNISRYNVEFIELEVIGSGQFGRVARCVNKLDGCVYALKRSLRPVAGSAAERAALNEVYAHAALGKHPHVVRYYSAWAEDDHMIIQNEYCDGGSLQRALDTSGPLAESELLLLLRHIAEGLAYIHSRQLVHMDVKPDNIFLCSDEGSLSAAESDDGFDEELPHRDARRKYKIGDLGHVTCTSSPLVEEGDCRFLPKEVLQEQFQDLTKADIFAFGLTLYEAAGGGPLPKNGSQWHLIRDGHLPNLPKLSRGLNQLLRKMVDPDPNLRPSASKLRKHQLLQPSNNKSKAQLSRELAAANQKNELLSRQLEEAARCIKSLTPTLVASQESAKSRTRSARRASKPKELQVADTLRAITSPLRAGSAARQRRAKPT